MSRGDTDPAARPAAGLCRGTRTGRGLRPPSSGPPTRPRPAPRPTVRCGSGMKRVHAPAETRGAGSKAPIASHVRIPCLCRAARPTPPKGADAAATAGAGAKSHAQAEESHAQPDDEITRAEPNKHILVCLLVRKRTRIYRPRNHTRNPTIPAKAAVAAGVDDALSIS